MLNENDKQLSGLLKLDETLNQDNWNKAEENNNGYLKHSDKNSSDYWGTCSNDNYNILLLAKLFNGFLLMDFFNDKTIQTTNYQTLNILNRKTSFHGFGELSKYSLKQIITKHVGHSTPAWRHRPPHGIAVDGCHWNPFDDSWKQTIEVLLGQINEENKYVGFTTFLWENRNK